jgi:hypothetical protein
MRCEIKTEYELPMCIEDICTPMEIPKFTASCSALHQLVGEPIEPVKVVIRGYEVMNEEVPYAESFTSEWE